MSIKETKDGKKYIIELGDTICLQKIMKDGDEKIFSKKQRGHLSEGKYNNSFIEVRKDRYLISRSKSILLERKIKKVK